VKQVSRGIDRIEVTFDDEHLVANAGLLLVSTLAARLGIEELVNATVRLGGRVGGALPGRKVLTLVHAIVAGGSHIDHADVLRSGATQAVLSHQVMAPSTLGTFLRAFTFGHVRQLEAVVGKVLERAWAQGAGPGDGRLVVDVDSTICEVAGHDKAGAAFGYTKVLGYHRAPRGAIQPGGMKGPPAARRSRSLKLEAVLPWRHRAGRKAASTTTGRVGTARRPGPGKRDGEVHACRNQWLNPLKTKHRLETWWIRAGQQRTLAGRPVSDSQAGGWCRPRGHGESLRRNCGEVAGEELGTHPVNRLLVNVGTAVEPPTLGPARP
jgi:hypothetical protein